MKIDEEAAYQSLYAQIPKDLYKQIVTIGRGGLGVAQRLAYRLDIPVKIVQKRLELQDLTKTDLFVDDIEDTSETVLSVSVAASIAVLVQKKDSMQIANYVGVVVDTEEYITFTWEVQDNE